MDLDPWIRIQLLTFLFRAFGFGKTIQILRFQLTGGGFTDGVKMNQMEEPRKTVYNIGNTQIQFKSATFWLPRKIMHFHGAKNVNQNLQKIPLALKILISTVN